MKTALLLFCLLLVFTLPISAQVMAPVDEMGEIFAGYSYMSAETGVHGWNVSGAYRPAPWLGLVADLSGHYGTDEQILLDVSSNVHNFLFGPRFYVELPDTPRWRPFGHLLFGASRINLEGTPPDPADPTFEVRDTAFAWALGGGIDYAFTENVAGRAVQADYIRTRWVGGGQNNYRLSFGLVYRWGR